MAETGTLNATRESSWVRWDDPVLWLRVGIIVAVLVIWEVLARSGWLYRDVVPPLARIVEAVIKLLSNPEYYWHLSVTAGEIGAGLLIGGLSGLAIGIVFGANWLLGRSFEPYLYYLGPTPKIIFFPIMIMWFGVGPGSKVAMGAISCFFPIALSAAAGMRQIDRVLIRVGQSFRCSPWQMTSKIYLPAMRAPILNGVRLGLGVALIGTLLAETKLSNRGIGFLIIQSYNTFDMPDMYSLLIVLFVIAIGMNALIGRFAADERMRR
jgi:ABC-type nitrate/sulfonate/bicarbonate transport system permease component